MTYDEWVKTYRPIKNHIDDNASMDGRMFETFGEELDFVRYAHPNRVWTVIDGEDGDTYLVDGYHLVNRIGYLISSKPHTESNTIEINLDED